MGCTYNLDYGMPILSQEDFKNRISENLPTNQEELSRLIFILSNQRVEIREVAFAGRGFFKPFFDDGNKYKYRITYSIKSKYFYNSKCEFLYNVDKKLEH